MPKIFESYADMRQRIRQHQTKGDRLVLVILIIAAILVDRHFGLAYVLLIVFPLAIVYGLIAGYFIRKNMRT